MALMPELDLTLDAAGAWPDLLQPAPAIAVWRRVGVYPPAATTPAVRIAGVGVYPPAATTPAVRIAIVLELPAGQRVFAYASWPELYRVLKAIEAQYGPPPEAVSGSGSLVAGVPPGTPNQEPGTPKEAPP